MKIHNFYFLVNIKTFLRDTIYYGVSGHYNFIFLTRRFCLSFSVLLQIRARTGISPFSSNISWFSVAVLFTKLVLLLVSFFCFGRKFVIAFFLLVLFLNLVCDSLKSLIVTGNSHYYYNLHCFSQKCWGVATISSSSNFQSVDFISHFISSISFIRFWNKTKLYVQSFSRCFKGLLGFVDWADESSEVLKLFLKNNDSGDFWVSEMTKVADSEKGGTLTRDFG